MPNNEERITTTTNIPNKTANTVLFTPPAGGPNDYKPLFRPCTPRPPWERAEPRSRKSHAGTPRACGGYRSTARAVVTALWGAGRHAPGRGGRASSAQSPCRAPLGGAPCGETRWHVRRGASVLKMCSYDTMRAATRLLRSPATRHSTATERARRRRKVAGSSSE